MNRLAGEELLALGFRDGIPFTAITKSDCGIHGWDIDCDGVDCCMSGSHGPLPLKFPDPPDTYWAADGVVVDCDKPRVIAVATEMRELFCGKFNWNNY